MEVISKYCEHKDTEREKWEVVVWYTLDDILNIKTGNKSLREYVVNMIYQECFPDTYLEKGHLELFNATEQHLFYRIIYTLKQKGSG